MRQTLRDLYELPSEEAFRSKLKAWCRWVKMVAAKNTYLFEPMLRAAKMIRTHMDGIVAFVGRRTTNAFMEGLMSVFSAVKRMARGYRSTDNRIAMIYSTADKLNLPAVTRPTPKSEEPCFWTHPAGQQAFASPAAFTSLAGH